MDDPSADPRQAAALALLGEPGWVSLLDAAAAFDGAGGDDLRAAEALRRRRPDLPGLRRAAALELTSEGARLAAKLGLSGERLLAVRGAVEQATSGRVAAWHASLVPAGARVVEIGCGCGGDSIALGGVAKNLIATDVDPVRAACTHQNLAAFGYSHCRAVPGDGLAVARGEGADADVVFADPDRRAAGVRSLDPEEWAPKLSELAALAAGAGTRGRRDDPPHATIRRRVLVKTAPSLDPDAAPQFHATFVSSGGECVECLLDGPVAPGDAQRVRAVLLPRDGPAVELTGSRGDAPVARAGGDAAADASIYVPDPAAIRARLLDELCRLHGLELVAPGIAWLAGPRGARTPWLAEHEILARPAFAATADALSALGAGSVRVHVRGHPASATDLARLWRKACRPGGPAVDVFVTMSGGDPLVVLARRLPS